MRTKQIIEGLNNTQKIRVILEGVGFYMQVKDILDRFLFTNQRVAVWTTLEQVSREKVQGMATSYVFYDEKMQRKEIQVQVDLL